MEAIFLDCGAGGPQLKRNPLGGDNGMHSKLRAFTFGALLLTPNAVSSQGAPACPTPAIDTSDWLRITADSPSVSFALPPAYRRKFYAVTVGTPPPSQEWRRDPFVSFIIEERPGPDSLEQ